MASILLAIFTLFSFQAITSIETTQPTTFDAQMLKYSVVYGFFLAKSK